MNRVSLTIAGIISSIALSIPVYLVVVFILDQIHEINDQSIPHYAPVTVVRLDMKVFRWLLKRLKGKRRDHHDT